MKVLLVSALFAVSASQARAVLDFYEPFDYSPTGVQLASVASPTWTAYAGGGVHATNFAGSLTYPGLFTSTENNSAQLNGSGATGTTARNLSQIFNSGTLYYSLTLNVQNISTADWGGSGNWQSGSFMLGFNQKLQNGTAIAQADAAAPLLIRTGDPSNTSGTANDFPQFQLGVGATATTATRTFDGTRNYNPGETLFVVVSYTFNDGTANDVARLWVNPVPGTDEASNTPAVTTAVGAVDVNSSQIQSFFLRNNSVEPANTLIDNLRVGTAWADVTPVPEPGTWALLAFGAGGLALVRRLRR